MSKPPESRAGGGLHGRERILRKTYLVEEGFARLAVKERPRIEFFHITSKRIVFPVRIVIVGGVIPHQDYDELYRDGAAAIFGPGTPIATAAIKILEILLAE